MEADSTVIDIRDGRHPISELCVESFVSFVATETFHQKADRDPLLTSRSRTIRSWSEVKELEWRMKARAEKRW